MARKRARELARGEGLKLLSCLSNIDEIYRAVGSKSFADTHSLRNAAGAHLFHGDLSCYLYSSAFPFRDIGVPRMFNASMGYIDPMLLPLLSTERLLMTSACAGLSRAEKTSVVATDPRAHHGLDVCVNGGHDRRTSQFLNCSTCWKCVRTLATLEALGEIEKFGDVFDLSTYFSGRTSLLSSLHARARSGVQLDQEVIDLQRSAGLQVPRAPMKHLAWTKRKLRSLARRAHHRIRSGARPDSKSE